MKRLDPHAVCAAFNKARMENQEFSYSVEEMKKLLKKYKIGTYLVPKMMSLNFFKRFRGKRGFSLSFTSEPIYEAQFRTLLNKKKKSSSPVVSHTDEDEEKEAIALLKSKGYRIFKVIQEEVEV